MQAAKLDDEKADENQSHQSVFGAPQNIVMIGQGLFGRALESHFLNHAPHYFFTTCTRRQTENPYDAVSFADFLILVVPASAHTSVMREIYAKIRPGTVLIDVSNIPLSFFEKERKEKSPAILLKKMVPENVHVVKSFNTLSAQTLMSLRPTFNPISIPYAADSKEAVGKMNKLLDDLGFVGRHWGSIDDTAEDIEKIPHRLFPGYKWPIITSLVVWMWWIVYTLISLYFFKNSAGEELREWWEAPSTVFMASTGEASMTMFSITFLAGPIAIMVQWWRGNSSSELSMWLSSWLDNRKELGMVSFFYLVSHTIVGAVSTFHLEYITLKDWRSSAAPLFGVVSFMLFSILAICSGDSVSKKMSWKEFRIVYAFLGTAALTCGLLHHVFWSWALHIKLNDPENWALGFLVPSYWLGVFLPILVIMIRALSWSPCVRWILRQKNRIRRKS